VLCCAVLHACAARCDPCYHGMMLHSSMLYILAVQPGLTLAAVVLAGQGKRSSESPGDQDSRKRAKLAEIAASGNLSAEAGPAAAATAAAPAPAAAT
jgi:hypothetical protein